MSEPLSAFLWAPLSRSQLARYLDAAVVPASHWSDWQDLGGRGAWRGFDFTTRLFPLLSRGDAQLVASADNRAAWRDLIENFCAFPDCQHLVRCRHDAAAGIFTIGSTVFTEQLSQMIKFLALARGVASFLAPGAQAFAVIRDYVNEYRDETAAVLVVEHGGSRLLHPLADAALCKSAVDRLREVAADLLQAAERAGGAGWDGKGMPPIEAIEGFR